VKEREIFVVEGDIYNNNNKYVKSGGVKEGAETSA
jgi:hypothetical protein